MSARDLPTQLEIKTPCTASWDQMRGNDRVRFCEHCQHTVNDLTSLTPKRIRRLIAKSQGRLCLRYHRRPDGEPLSTQVPKKLHQIRKRVSRVAAGVFTASLSLGSATGQQSTAPNYQRWLTAQVGSVPMQLGTTIRGKITNTNQAAIEGAGVTLSNDERIFLSGTLTNAAGEYSFSGLLPGRYLLTIEAHGYKSSGLRSATVGDNESLVIDHTLEAESPSDERERFVTMGAVAVSTTTAEPLIAAAIADDLQALEASLTRANVNVRDKNLGTTALEYAVRNGNREMVQVLLSAGADVNSVNNSKETVLMMLGEEASADIVWDLVHAGAKVDLKDEDGETALMASAEEKNLPALTALVHAGAKLDLKNGLGQTALMLAVQTNQLANIRFLIRSGADLNAQDDDGWTVLDYAFTENNEVTYRLLRSYGAVTGTRKK